MPVEEGALLAEYLDIVRTVELAEAIELCEDEGLPVANGEGLASVQHRLSAHYRQQCGAGLRPACLHRVVWVQPGRGFISAKKFPALAC